MRLTGVIRTQRPKNPYFFGLFDFISGKIAFV